jgi:diguanylate cyclase (GGDEF)-like protein
MQGDRRQPGPRLRALEMIEEKALGGRLAGILYLTGAVTATAILLVPGVETRHWRIMLGLAAIGLAWALCCLFVVPWERASPLVSHFSSALGFPITAVAVASTGGAESPAVFYLLFIVGYCAYFYRRREAIPYLVACVIVHALPLLYDPGAVNEGLVAQLLILGPTYLLLGGLIIAGKARLVELRDEAQRLSLVDPLTGLANRRALMDALEAGTAAGRGADPLGLVLVDLDGFKEANTMYGHPGGDTALIATAGALRSAARSEDVVARLGGDEFAIVSRGHGVTATALSGLADRALCAVRSAGSALAHMPGYELRCSVGVALYPEDAHSVDDLVATADVCMRGAKATGKDRALSTRDFALESPDAPAAVA